MCQVTDMGRVANYGYRALEVATNVGMQAANVFIGGRRRLQERRAAAHLGGADTAAQQALLARIDLPSWAR
jgi:hypothetical protein